MADDTRTLAQRVRAAHPGAYDDLSDQQLESAVVAKYPGAYDDVPRTSTKNDPSKAAMFRPEDQTDKSVTGFIGNAVNDVYDIAHSLRHPLDTLSSMVKAKNAQDAADADEIEHPEKHPDQFSQPGDRLAAQFKQIPGIIYEHPINNPVIPALGGLKGLANGEAGLPRPSMPSVHPAVKTAAGVAAKVAAAKVGGAPAVAAKIATAFGIGKKLFGKEVEEPHMPTAAGYEQHMPNVSAPSTAPGPVEPGPMPISPDAEVANLVDHYMPNVSGAAEGGAAVAEDVRGVPYRGIDKIVPPENAGGTMKPKQVPAIVHSVNDAIDKLKQGDIAELKPAASHPTTGSTTRAVEDGSVTLKRTGKDPIVVKAPPKPKSAPGVIADGTILRGSDAAAAAQEAIAEAPLNPKAPPVAETPKAAEPKPTTDEGAAQPEQPPTTATTGSKSKRKSEAAGLSDADVDALAKQLGMTREQTLVHLREMEIQKALRNIEHMRSHGAKPTSIEAAYLKNRAKFGDAFGK